MNQPTEAKSSARVKRNRKGIANTNGTARRAYEPTAFTSLSLPVQERMSKISFRSCVFGALALLLLFALPAYPQALAPAIHPQFVNSSGQPLAGGFLYSYQAGTSTPQATYADPGLTIANANPIPLDATGAPSNSSGAEVEVWLSNANYRFCAYNSSLVQQWCVDNISTYLGLLNQANVWSFAQTFSLPLTVSATDNQLIFGVPGNQTTLDVPPANSGNVTLHTPNTSDTLVGRATTDTLTNKTLTAPTITNAIANGVNTQLGTAYTVVASDEQKLLVFKSSSAVSVTLPQANTTGFGSGAKFSFSNIGTGAVTITPTTSTIDGAASLTLATNQGVDVYSDGANYSTQRGAGIAGYKFEVKNLTPATVSNTTASSNLITYTMPANEIGIGQTFYFDAQGIIGATTLGGTSNPNLTITVVLDGVSVCSINPTLFTASSQPWALHGFFTGLSIGSSGSVTGCHLDWSSTSSGGGHIGNEVGVGFPAQSVTLDTTISHTFALQVTWGVANALNTVSQNTLIIYRIG